jgi:hypothetical protein
LITALIERWRQETHTFHLPCGEATVTLQDVAVLFGLPIEGPPIAVQPQTKAERDMWCEQIWGSTPLPQYCKANSQVSGRYFDDVVLGRDLVNGSDADIQAYAMAWMMQMVCGVLFPDKSSGYIKTNYCPLLVDTNVINDYSWGSSVLAMLYREMCKACHIGVSQIGGPILLLQLWAWERLVHIRPTAKAYVPHITFPDGNYITCEERPPLAIRWTGSLEEKNIPTHKLIYYRDQLDLMHDYEMLWQPYDEELLFLLPSICTTGHVLWTVTTPLIHNVVVEWVIPYRVLRQFGCVQEIPDPFDTCVALHAVKETGKRDEAWMKKMEEFILYWNDSYSRIPNFNIARSPPECSRGYMDWYNSITRRLIGRPPVSGRQKKGAKS